MYFAFKQIIINHVEYHKIQMSIILHYLCDLRISMIAIFYTTNNFKDPSFISAIRVLLFTKFLNKFLNSLFVSNFFVGMHKRYSYIIIIAHICLVFLVNIAYIVWLRIFFLPQTCFPSLSTYLICIHALHISLQHDSFDCFSNALDKVNCWNWTMMLLLTTG